MSTEQQPQPPLAKKYNLFCPSQTIPIPKGYSVNRQNKREIKLVFHHPNLLFLNPNKHKMKQELPQKDTNILVSPKGKVNHSSKSSKQFRPYTSYFQSKGSRRNTAVNTPCQKQKSREQNLQVCGKSSPIAKEQPYLVPVRPIKTSGATLGRSGEQQMRNDVFGYMQRRVGGEKKEAWGQLMEGNKVEVRLNMYLQVQKKFNKYVNKYR